MNLDGYFVMWMLSIIVGVIRVRIEFVSKNAACLLSVLHATPPVLSTYSPSRLVPDVMS